MRKQERRGASQNPALGGGGQEGEGHKKRTCRVGQGLMALFSWEDPLCALICHLFGLNPATSLALFKAVLGALGTPWDLCSSFV